MKRILKSVVIVCVIAVVFGTMSCSNIFQKPAVEAEERIVSYDAIANRLGDVNRIIKDNSGRFVTGQIVEIVTQEDLIMNGVWRTHSCEFEGNLVEYNSVNQNILDYVSSMEANALMHQSHGMEPGDFIDDKIYVELSTYRDVESGKVWRNEIRIFNGSDVYNPNRSCMGYAKAVTFNSDFTMDVDRWVPVDFNLPEVAEEKMVKINSTQF